MAGGGTRPQGGRLSWLVLVIALALAAAVAGIAKIPGLAASLGIAAAAVGAVVLGLGNALRAQLDQRAKTRVTDRALTAGAPKTRQLLRDVSPRDVRVNASVRDDIDYIERDLQHHAIDTLKLQRRLLIVAPSMAGKTRLALNVAKTALPDWELERPADGKSLHQRLADNTTFHNVLVWLDDLERFTATGLTDADLTTLLQSPSVAVIATIRTSEYEALQPTGQVKPTGWEVAAWFDQTTWLHHTWTDAELDRLAHTRTGPQVLPQARQYGLGPYLGGAPLVGPRLQIGREQHPFGYAAVDWRRIGMTQKLALDTLTTVLPAYTRLPQTPAHEKTIETAISWATTKLNQTVALVIDDNGLEALDLVLDTLTTTEPIPQSLTDIALHLATPPEQMALGFHAYSTDQTDLAITAWQTAAEAGNTNAASNLGFLLDARLDPPDLDGARNWYQQAAEAGDTDAEHNLALLLATRIDPPDLDGARHWWTRAADSGDTDAQYNLALLLEDQLDPPDLEGAQRWYQQAADAGHADAAYNLGKMLADRLDPPDLDGAQHWYRQAARAGDTDAAFNLGYLLVMGIDPPDLAGARHWWTQAADAGNTNAAYNLGFLFATRLDPPDLDGAQHWYQQAADAGHTDAAFNLGNLLANRLDTPDLDRAQHWYQQAADAGNTDAAFTLGKLLATRIDPPDLNGAQHWWTQAAVAGHPDAANVLALLLGAPPDPT